MSAEILSFTGMTCVDEPPEQLLEKAKAWGMERCVVVGFDEAGELCFGGSFGDTACALLMLKLAERQLLDNSVDARNPRLA